MQWSPVDNGVLITGPWSPAVAQRLERARVLKEGLSSYWRHHGERVRVDVAGSTLRLEASGFRALEPPTLPAKTIAWLNHRDVWPRIRHLRHAPAFREAANALCGRLGVVPDVVVLQAVGVLATIAEHRPAPKSMVIIGDGCGITGTLARMLFPGLALSLIDLPTQLLFQAAIHESIHGAGGVTYLEPDEADRLESVDMAINVASFQEMTPATIERYVRLLRARAAAFYCVNRWEKTLYGGEVVRFDQFHWQPSDRILVDGPCPFYPPFWVLKPYPHRVPFDGQVWQRLVEF